MQKVDIGGGRGWLAPDPAASIARIDAEIGHALPTSSTGRYDWEQQELLDRFAAGDPNIFQPAAVGTSPHELGISADVPKWWLYEAVMNRHGWTRPLPKTDPVHFNYDRTKDQHYGEDADMTPEDRKLLQDIRTTQLEDSGKMRTGLFGQVTDMQLRITSLHEGSYLPIREGAPGGTLAWLDEKLAATAVTITETVLGAIPGAGAVDAGAVRDAVREGVREALRSIETVVTIEAQ